MPPAPCTTGSTMTAASSSRVRVDQRVSSQAVAVVERLVDAGRRRAGAKTCAAARRANRWCMPSTGSQTDIAANVSPW